MEKIIEVCYEDIRDMEKKSGAIVQDNNELRAELEKKC